VTVPSTPVAGGPDAGAVCIVGTGSYLPDRVLTNRDLETMVDTTDEWIVTRTGIRERHLARDDQASSDLAAEAARRALAAAGLQAPEVDLILVATITPDMFFPSTACCLQKAIGAERAFCFDLEAACSGFLYATETARQFLLSGSIRTALVVAAEKLSCITDWKDRATCVLFGDGAGAAVLQRRPGRRGILSTYLGADGNLAHLLSMPGGGSRHPATEQTVKDGLHVLKMAGREVFKHAVNAMTESGRQAMARAGVGIGDIACVIPHQANQRIVQAVAERLGAPPERCYVNLDRCGNMSAASIPVALDEALRKGAVKPGDLALLVAFGGGFTWGAMVVEV
jgi:3-oxoacyl-[acyl-carrier-protein] synthase-3